MDESPARNPEQLAEETAELTVRLHHGDRAAFQALYDRLTPALYAWTHLRLQGSPAAGVEPQDVLQEAWLRALRGLAGFDPSLSFRRWIFGIAKNILLQSMRDSTNAVTSGRRPLHGRPKDLLEFPDSVTSISSRLANDDLVQRFLAYVAELPSEERQLVLYCGLEGYTSSQAAERLGILPDTALKRWQTLRSRLRESGTLKALCLEDVA